MVLKKVTCTLLAAIYKATFLLFSFAGISFCLKKELIQKHLFIYFDLFNGIFIFSIIIDVTMAIDSTVIPFILMSFLYLFAYIINDFYVSFSQALAISNEVCNKYEIAFVIIRFCVFLYRTL